MWGFDKTRLKIAMKNATRFSTSEPGTLSFVLLFLWCVSLGESGAASSTDLAKSQRKMAILPELAQLHFPSAANTDPPAPGTASTIANVVVRSGVVGGKSGVVWPILRCGSVFVLPGVPHLFEEKLKIVCNECVEGPGQQLHTAKVVSLAPRCVDCPYQ